MRTLLIAMIVVSGCAFGASCASAADRYRAKSADCVARYDTRATIDACRAAVRAEFGVSDVSDAGRSP
jgi:hypothetical protein